MKSFALIAVAATLLQSTSALPSANGVSIVGDAQHVEERNVNELEKRQTRSRMLWKDRLVLFPSLLSLACTDLLPHTESLPLHLPLLPLLHRGCESTPAIHRFRFISDPNSFSLC